MPCSVDFHSFDQEFGRVLWYLRLARGILEAQSERPLDLVRLGQHRVILEALLLFLLLLGGLVQQQTLSHIVSDLIATDTLVILSCIA